jgi:hypothetical protein
MSAIESEESVAAVARAACLGGHTAVLCAEVPGDVGYLFFLKGELVHAASLDLEGEAAAVEVLAWQGASLGWCERRWPRERTIAKDLSGLLESIATQPLITTSPADSEAEEAEEAEEEPPPESQARRAPPSALHARFPTAVGVSRALLCDGFKNVLSVNGSGLATEARGSHQHLKAIASASTVLGDLFGEALGLGPLFAAEASSSAFYRIVARSADGSTVAETTGGSALSLARAFLKL